jgi:2'-5' RNA ligase
MDSHETPEAAALRELHEEVGTPPDLSGVRHLHTNDHGNWQYHTIGGTVAEPYEPDQYDHETQDTGWFTPAEMSELPLHSGFRQTWDKLQDTQRTAAAADELHIALEIPNAIREQIHKWASEQDWPEGTKLEDPSEYHITLMYTPGGYIEHGDADWIKHIDSAKVRTTGFACFEGDGENPVAYVLRLDAPKAKLRAQSMQGEAEKRGLEVTHFPGGYKPHLTVAYGPSKIRVKAPKLTFESGPSAVSPPRKEPDTRSGSLSFGMMCDTSGLEGPHKHLAVGDDSSIAAPASGGGEFAGPEGRVLDHLSLSSVAHNLHYRFEQGLDAQGAKDYAGRLLRLIGYPDDEITVQAAIQAWQQMYPQDDILNPNNQIPVATTPSESWGSGTVSKWQPIPNTILLSAIEPLTTRSNDASQRWRPKVATLYHWTDTSRLDWMNDRISHPVRLTIDSDFLDPDLFEGNRYMGAIPKEAVLDVHLSAIRPWSRGSGDGKFSITPDGGFHHWQTDDYGNPHHAQVAQELGLGTPAIDGEIAPTGMAWSTLDWPGHDHEALWQQAQLPAGIWRNPGGHLTKKTGEMLGPGAHRAPQGQVGVIDAMVPTEDPGALLANFGADQLRDAGKRQDSPRLFAHGAAKPNGVWIPKLEALDDVEHPSILADPGPPSLEGRDSTVPSEVNNPDDRWPEFGDRNDDERHHYDPQIGNEFW